VAGGGEVATRFGEKIPSFIFFDSTMIEEIQVKQCEDLSTILPNRRIGNMMTKIAFTPNISS
jgi:hypothetical protein